jgi:hypothetical protein
MQRKADRDPRALATLCARLDHALKLAGEAARTARQPKPAQEPAKLQAPPKSDINGRRRRSKVVCDVFSTEAL